MRNIHKLYKLILLFPALLLSVSLSAQEAEASNFQKLVQYTYDNMIIVLGALALFAGVVTIINLIFKFIELQKIRTMQEMGIEKEEVVSSLRAPTMKKMYDWLWSYVPVAKEKTIDLGHEYDGIRELDNRLPPWWLGLMYGSIIFAAVYMFYYHWRDTDWSSTQEYAMEMEKAEEQKALYLERMANAVDEKSVVIVDDEASLAAGKDIYISKCAACHGQLGEGLVGPNFTDEYWIHGGSVNDLFSTIKYGVPEKGMISWSSQLRPASIQNVASYILTLQGTNPPNQKAPEGELYVPPAQEEGMAEEGENTEEAENLSLN